MKRTKYFKGSFYECECGKTFLHSQSLNAHFSHCEIHHSSLGTVRKKRPHEISHTMSGWSKFSKEELQEIHNKTGKTLSEKIAKGELKASFQGRKQSEEAKKKLRESTIAYLKLHKNFQGPRYSEKACKFIDELNSRFGFHLQHALNGGEFSINGYFVDGYDKELNLVFEYDEEAHYKDLKANLLKDKDLRRQNNIIQKLHCRFIRFNEKENILYEVLKDGLKILNMN